jgi:hypothetical protein
MTEESLIPDSSMALATSSMKKYMSSQVVVPD